MRHYQTSKIRGFTLVELAIVITIIGILIGGVLKGQQLIDQARLAATINQINNYRSALMIFKTTYNELPGDMIDPDARIVGCDGCKAFAPQGDLGNGFIDASGTAGPVNIRGHEKVFFWLHLYKANMINGVTDAALTEEKMGVGTTYPAAKIGGGFFGETAGGPTGEKLCGSTTTYTMWGQEDGCQPSPGMVMMIHAFNNLDHLAVNGNWRVMTPLQMASVDRKLDDGKPLSGTVRGASMSSDMYGCANDDDAYPEAETNSKACTIGVLIEQ